VKDQTPLRVRPEETAQDFTGFVGFGVVDGRRLELSTSALRTAPNSSVKRLIFAPTRVNTHQTA
jgi:hypothetical protein